jgi:hypothetical protein
LYLWQINDHLIKLFAEGQALILDFRAIRRKKLSINLADIGLQPNRNRLLHQIALAGGKRETVEYLIHVEKLVKKLIEKLNLNFQAIGGLRER